jgi:hypothetical protein
MAHRIALLIAGAATVIASAVGTTASADELRTVVPQPRESPPQVDPMLVMTGAALFGVPYVGSVAMAAGSRLDADRWLYLPVFGPVGDYVHRHVCTTMYCRGNDLGTVALPLMLDHVVQAAGLGVMVYALAKPSKPAPVPAPAAKSGATILVLPTASVSGAGVTAFGTF